MNVYDISGAEEEWYLEENLISSTNWLEPNGMEPVSVNLESESLDPYHR